MNGPIYFQWQNPALLETIYTSRERKLRDFLIYYKEIDLWKQYKDQKIGNLESDVQQYIASRETTMREAYKSYKDLLAYFTSVDVRARYAKYTSDEKDLAKVALLHKTFAETLPRISDVHKEKIFATRMLLDWEAYLKKTDDDLKKGKRRQDALLNQVTKATEKKELDRIENILLKIANEEWLALRTLVSAYNKVEKRKLEFTRAKDAAQIGIKGARARLDLLRTQLNAETARQREISTDLARLKAPPTVASVQGHFTGDDAPGHVRSAYPNADPTVMNTLNALRQKLASDLRALKDEGVKQVTIKNLLYALQKPQTDVNKEISQIENELRVNAADWPKRGERQGRLNALREAQKAIEAEIDKVQEYKAAVDYSKKTPLELAQLKQAREKELLQSQQRYSQLGKDADALEAQVKSFESILNRSEEDYLVRYTPDQPITVKDIVRNKAEAYEAALANKDQYALLEMIIQRFVDAPERYPLWLQYMVIHFSGMRYASAHGSWADPKDLLSSLLTPRLEKRFKQYDDNGIEPLCEQRITLYETTGVLSPDAPALARAADAKTKTRIAEHLKGLKSPLPHQRRKAYYDLLLDEQEYEIEIMKPEEVLAKIKEIGKQDNFPDWMWSEIIRLTELRLQEVKSKEWEKLTPAQQEERNDAKYAEYRVLMNKWKEQNLAGWREEHDKTNRLIVSRSVCNEVAEQIQHLRGNSPGGGLTAKPQWYMNLESQWIKKGKPAGQETYFRKPRVKDDYKVGASILWLKFVNDLPNPWRMAKSLTTSQGDKLIPQKYLDKTTADDWNYSMGDPISRTRRRLNEKKQLVPEQQYLRWIHEATVADVVETADGNYVLTFETALPYDDPRISTIGVFKRSLNDLLNFDGGEEYYNGSFVGYTPEGQLPMSDLKEMLDWDKILLKKFVPVKS